ncbi:MAG: Xaa-Pro peptidase family protein [Nitrospirota bacterium]
MTTSEARLRRLQKDIRTKGIDALYVGSMKNVRYLTGFTGSSGFALVTRDRGIFATDFRYTEQAAAEVRGYELESERGPRIKAVKSLLKRLGIRKLGFETSISYELYEALEALPVQLLPQKGLVERMRLIKSAEEIATIHEAVRRAERAFLAIKPRIKAGVKEREIALRLEEQLKREGCRSIPFAIIVAAGRNAALPHAQPTEKKIQKGDFVIIDWGGEADGYYSDMTRTLLMAGPSLPEKKKIYDLVNDAREKAIGSVRKGVRTRAIDAAARDTIAKAGYGAYFGHGTGHGVGLDVHEAPRISWLRSEPVMEGMVFTVEPGIYIPELGGVRIEDMVAVEQGKGRVLTSLGRGLEIIGS